MRAQLTLLRDDPTNPKLGIHPLRGSGLGQYSVDVGGDVRAIFQKIGEDALYFIEIGTHHQLYKK